jgi:hypothetical protein
MPPTKSKQPVQRLEDIDLYRRYYSQKERESMDEEDFAGPHRSFPIKTQADVHNAARLIGHADNPDAVKAKIKAIAKRKGFSLPKEWQDEEDSKESSDRTAAADVTRIASEHDGGHEDPSGDAVGMLDEGRDDMDGVDDGREDLATILRTLCAQDIHYYAPITRINKEKREVIGVATAERKDAYRTVIGYEASKDALGRWRGNIREMHDPKKAVGRALEVTPDDVHKHIVVRAKISKGAEDTWQKVLDGTLTGFSIGGRNGTWTQRTIDGEELPYLERYDAVELSLVDNPACPGCNVEVVRADGVASDILAKDEEMDPKPKQTKAAPPATVSSVERAGARLSAETREAMHQARDHAMNAAKSSMTTCGCDDCTDMLNQINAHDDNDGDVDANYLAPASMRKLVADIVRSEITTALPALVAPMIARVNALLASDAQRTDEQPEISRRVDSIAESLAAIKDLVEKIAAQPVDGGPILHGAAPVDKRLATQGQSRGLDDPEIMRRALELGFAPPTSPQDQVKAAASMIRPIPR